MARSAARQRERTVLAHRVVRYCVQVAFFIFAPAVFSGAFAGIKYIFTCIGAVDGIEMTAFVMLLVAALAFTVVFGRFFCGYACAFGTLGDVLFGVFEFLRVRAGIPRPRFPGRLVKALSLLKYAVLAGICIACALGVWSAVSSASPWEAFASIIAGSFDALNPVGASILIAIAVGMVVRERFFCQFLCPLGAVFSLMPVLGSSEFTRTRAHCARKCGRCQEACPVDIWPDADTLEHGECISCGRCADVCPMSNVNLVALERPEAKRDRLAAEAESPAGEVRPLRKTREGWRLLRGTGVGLVLVKAALFLLVFWLAGATRYLP